MNILRRRRKSNKKSSFRKIILVIFSLIMTTFAWFAYSKVINPTLNIHIAAWDMEYYIKDEKQKNPMVIEIPILYPTMKEEVVTVDIKNNGEALVEIDYHIESITIAGVTYDLITGDEQNTTQNYIRIGTPNITFDQDTGEALAKGTIINEPEKFPFTMKIEHTLQIEARDKGYMSIITNWIGDDDDLDSEWGYIVGDYFSKNPEAKSAMSLKLSVDSYQVDEEILPNTEGLPKAPGTKPYLPSADYTQVEGTDLNTGLVITDQLGNEYVWIEVPKVPKIYQNAGIQIKDFTDEEYDLIEEDLHTYTSEYRDGTIYKDEYSDAKSTGLTSDEYIKIKKKMLKSVYQNGGFYIGRYETGIDTNRKGNGSITSIEPKIQANKFPLNYINCSEAQTLASGFAPNNRTSSLLFGVQWDLVLKYMETKAVAQGTEILVIQEQLKNSSKTWGNYKSSSYSIVNTNAQYSSNMGMAWETITLPYNKTSAEAIFLTTGANSTFCKQNIFDFAGNAWEWTLERTMRGDGNECVPRGGSYEDNTKNTAHYRASSYASYTDFGIGFRVAIY